MLADIAASGLEIGTVGDLTKHGMRRSCRLYTAAMAGRPTLSKRARRHNAIESAAWGGATCAVLLWHWLFAPHSEAQALAAVGVVALLYGVRVFLVHGGTRITALGLFNLACAMFVGYAAVYHSSPPPEFVPLSYLITAATLALASQIGIAFVARLREPGMLTTSPSASPEAAGWAIKLGTVVMATTIAGLTIQAFPSSVIVGGLGFTGATLIAAGQIFHPRYRLLSWRTLHIAAAFALYVEVFHHGSGRLHIVALGTAIGFIASTRFRDVRLKWAALASVPLALAWLAQHRLEFVETLHHGASVGRTGLESIMSPLPLFAQVLQHQHIYDYPLAWGRTLITVPFSLLPANLGLWQPEALGDELVAIADPARVGSGWNVAGTAFGEWVYNFGVPGLFLAVVVVGWLIAHLDGAYMRAVQDERAEPHRLVAIVVFALAVGGLSDYAWSGVHTAGMRLVTRLPLILLAILLLPHSGRLGPLLRSFHSGRGRPRPSRPVRSYR